MEIKLDFNEENINYMWHTGSKSFVSAQLTRFAGESKDIAEIIKYELAHPKDENPNGASSEAACLRFCDTYLEAKIYQSYCKAKYPNTFILSDEATGEWCVWVPEPLFKDEKKKRGIA